MTSYLTSHCHFAAHPLRGRNWRVTREVDLSFGFTSHDTPCEVLTRTYTTSHLSPLRGEPPTERSATPPCVRGRSSLTRDLMEDHRWPHRTGIGVTSALCRQSLPIGPLIVWTIACVMATRPGHGSVPRPSVREILQCEFLARTRAKVIVELSGFSAFQDARYLRRVPALTSLRPQSLSVESLSDGP